MKHLRKFNEEIESTKVPTIEEIRILLDTTDGSCEGTIGDDSLIYYQDEINDSIEDAEVIEKYYGWELKDPNYNGISKHDTDYVPFSVKLISPSGKVYIASGIGSPADIQIKKVK